MSVEDFKLVLETLDSHTGIVDLHGFGEPLLDSDLVTKIRMVSRTWPNARSRIYTTLGVTLSNDTWEQLAFSGIREIEVSFYGFTPNAYREVHGVHRFDLALDNLTRLCRLKKGVPELDIVMRAFPTHSQITPPNPHEIAVEFWKRVQELGVGVIRERDLHNFGSGRLYNLPGRGKTCSIIWGYRKRILQVTWDLKVIPCCFDFDASMILGDLRTSTLEQIFMGSPYTNFIEAHVNDNLSSLPVCAGCERCFKP